MKTQNSYQESLKVVLAHSQPLGKEMVSFHKGLGRVLAEAVVSPINDPPAALSAMDGFCLEAKSSQGASPSHPVILPFSDTLGAGHLPAKKLLSGQACRLMTGAILPQGADAVIKQEDVVVEANTIALARGVQPGENIWAKGVHLEVGQPILQAGQRITPQTLGMLAKLGQSELCVYRQPRVALLAIGDELVEVGQPLQPGQLHVSNLYSMAATIGRSGGIPHRLGIVPDHPAQIEQMLHSVLASDLPENTPRCDMIMTLGGSSKGDFDFVHTVLERLDATIHFRKTALNLGPSTIFATLGNLLFFGLPGTPVPSWGAFELLMRPSFWKQAGRTVLEHPRLQAQLTTPLNATPNRQCFFPGWLVFTPQGLPTVTPLRTRATPTLPSSLMANALIEVEAGVAELEAGDSVWVQWVVLG